MMNFTCLYSDHFCHLYGPSVLYEPSGKAKNILGSNEDFFDIQRDEDDEDDDDDDDQDIDSDGEGAAVGLLTPQRKVSQRGHIHWNMIKIRTICVTNEKLLQFSVASSVTDPTSTRAPPPPPNVISPTLDSNAAAPMSAPPDKKSFSVRASFRSRQRAVTLPKSGTREERQYLRQTLRRNPYK